MRNKLKIKMMCVLLIVLAAAYMSACTVPAVYAPDQLIMYTGVEHPMGAVVVPFGSAQKIKYSSSDTSVASVSGSGIITARAMGTASVTACVGKKTAVTVVKVIIPAESISIPDTAADTLTPNQTLPLKEVIAQPEHTTALLTWESSNPSVARIVNNAEIKALAAGTAEITGTYRHGEINQTVSYTVIVLEESVFNKIQAAQYLRLISQNSGSNTITLTANAENRPSYAEYLRNALSAAHNPAGTVFYFADADYGYEFTFSGENGVDITICNKKRLNINALINDEYLNISGMYITEAAPLNEGNGFRITGYGGCTKTEAEETLINTYGDSYTEEGGAYIFRVKQGREYWIFEASAQDINGVVRVTIAMYREEIDG